MLVSPKYVYDNTPNTKRDKWEKKELKNPVYIADMLEITIEQAQEVIAYDESDEINRQTDFEKEQKEVKKDKKKPTGIQQNELDEIIKIANVMTENGTPTFHGRDIHKFMSDLVGIRGMQSRMKRLANEGLLIEVGDTTPKTYKLV